MDFNLSEEQELLSKSARDFFVKELPKSLVKEMPGDEKGYPPELWSKMAGLGWMGLIIPEEYDGMGGSFLDLAILLEEMGRASLPGPFFSTVVLGVSTILEAGSADQKQKLLPKVAGGDLILTLALTETNVLNSFDLIEVEAKASGDEYAINGTKFFVPDAHVADYIICLAKTDGAGKSTLFLVDAKSTGVNCTVIPTVSGEKQCEVVFNNVKVSKGDVIGEAGQGQEYLEKILTKAAVAKCAEMMGGVQQVLDMSVAYTKERVQFGKPIGSFQAIQHHIANMAMDVEGCRFMTYQAAWLISEGRPCAKEVAMTKAWLNTACQRTNSLGHQVHGAIAWQSDHDMHLYIKQAIMGEALFGDTYYQEEVVARELGL